MRSKKAIEKELLTLKRQLNSISLKASDLKSVVTEKDKSDQTSSQMFSLLRYMIDENKKTTMVLNSIANAISKLEEELSDDSYEDQQPMQYQQPKSMEKAKEVMLSGTDAKIIQFLQLSPNSMACANDLKKYMNYKGNNAASSRLNRLYKLGMVERYQLGHKVYYKYDAGKATNTLIVSPPQ